MAIFSDSGKYCILPVPYAGKVSYGQGAQRGPQAILDACSQLEYFDLLTKTRPADEGIVVLPEIKAADDDSMVDAVHKACSGEDRFTILIGGDHSTAIGAVQAAIKKHKNLSVLQLDAHPDLFYSWNDSKNNHRCFGHHAKQAQALVQVGLRAADEDEIQLDVHQHFAHDKLDIQKILDQLTDTVYISIDVDVFDPSVIRHTGTPEPGGYDWNAIINILTQVFKNKKVIGCDIVEFAPNGAQELWRVESYTLAKLLYTTLALKADS